MSSRVLIKAGMGLVAIAALLVCFGAYNDAAFAQMPTVLVIDDDSGKADVGNGRELAPRDPATRGLSADGMAAHLTALGYDVTLETSVTSDPATWPGYDFIISSTGASTTPLDATYMANLVTYVQGGGKLLIEGGEVGYNHQTGDFATQVLHILDWDTDNAGTLDIHPDQTGHAIANNPNVLPTSISITYSGYGDMDANEIATDAFIVYGTTNYPDDCGVLVYDDNPNPVSAQIVYYAFNWAAVDNRGAADNLLENTAAFITAEETGPTAGISGYVDLTDTGDDSGVLMELTGPASASTTTDATGYYEFTELYPGSYNVTATPPAGYFPESATQSGIVVADVMVTDVNFTFDPMVLGSVAGTVTLENNPDASGVVVEILGQGISMVTGSDGVYSLTGVTPGNITVRASKEGYATETRFEFLDNGGSLVGIDFFLGESGGLILVIDDDYVARQGVPTRAGKPRDESTIGLSATEMAAHLTSLGYTVTEEQSGTSDPASWPTYDLVISSTGANTSDLDATYRANLVTYVQGGGKLLIEGGEIGYNHYSDDPAFAAEVLHINDWDSDNAGPLTIVPGQEAHPIATTPNALPASMPITYSGYGDEDANDPTPDAFHVYAPANYMTHCGINVYDDTPEPTSAQIVFFAFNWFVVQTSTDRDNLLENTVAFLLAEETGGLGSIAGVADLTDTGDDSGTHVVLTGIVNDEVYTGPDGSFTFTGLFDGNYTITMTPPAGYFPYETEVADIAVAAGPVDIGTYAFDPIVGGTVSGTAMLSDNPDYSGITVEVIGQGISMVTGSDGVYSLAGVNPGDIVVKASKDGYRSGVSEQYLPNGGSITGLDFLLEPGTDEFFTDFEANNGDFVADPATGGWEWGAPTAGPGGAYSGVNVWGTWIGGDYANSANWKLDSPDIDVSGFANVLLKFWHWYTTESYWDGGNVKISTDGGATWTIIEPVDGYPEDAASTANSGIPGEPCFSGSVGGFWHLAQFNLNAYAGGNVMIRWHFGSDGSVNGYPGWFIDDVGIVDDVVKLPPENLVATGGLENHVPLDWTHPEETPKRSIDYDDVSMITGPDAELELAKRAMIPTADRAPFERPTVKDGRPVIGYHVYRSETSGGPYVDESGLIVPSDYDDTNVVNGTPYYYVVTADYGAFGESDATPEVSATPENNPPPVPQNLTATVVDRDVTLNWDPVVAYDLDGYNVYRKQDEGDWMLHASTPAGTETFMENLAIDGVFQYRVTSFDSQVPSAESAPSNTVTVPMGILPPTFLNAEGGNDGHIPLDWMAPGTSDFPPYEIIYDDGTFENGLALNAAANGLAVRFTPLGYPFTVDTGKWYIDDYGLPTAPLTVRVYDDDGPVAGGTILAEATGVASPGPSVWVEYTFDSPVTITEGDFYVACIWEIGANPGPTCYVGLDENGTFEDRTWLIIDSGATWSQDELHTYFPGAEIAIRCIGRGPVPKSADLAVESYELTPTTPRRVESSASLALGQPSLFGESKSVNEAPHFIFSQNATKETLIGYNLYRSETSPVAVDPANFVASTGPTVLEYDDWGPGGLGLSNGTEYFYVATADYGPDGESGPSGEASAIPENAPPPDPENLVATLVDRDVTLDWDPVVVYDLNSYNVYRSFNYGDFVLHANVPTETFAENLALDGVYAYKVTTVDNDGGESGFSNTVTVAVGILPPRNLRAQSGYDGNIPLTWSEPGGTGGAELNILLVSDPADEAITIENYDAVYTHGFETAGLAYTIWDHQTQGEPTLTDLQDYNCIFWYTATSGGSALTHACLSLAEEQTLVDWMNLGDRFLCLSGIWIAWNCIADATAQQQVPSVLFDDYIKLDYPPENYGAWIYVTNSWFLDGLTNPVGADIDWPINWVSGENYPDQLESTVPASGNECFTWMDPNVSHHQGGISYDGGSFKTVFLACPVEQVGAEADKDLLIANILNWFGGAAKDLDLSMLAMETAPVKVDPGTANLGQTNRATGKGHSIDMSVAAGYYPAPVRKENNVVAYNLYRSETSPVTVDPANFVASTPHDVLEYVDWGPGNQGLTNGTEYFYTVTADYGPDGESTGAAEDSAIPANAAPAAPLDFAARLKPDHVKLDWAECHVYDMDYYNVYRKQTGGGTKQEDFVLIATGLEDPHYYDTITSEGIYFYYATVVDKDGAESEPSNNDFVVFGVLPPNSLTAHDGPTFVPVTWMAPGELPEYELIYDDGTFENGLALNAAANGLAVRFTPLGYPCRVGTASWYIDDYGLPTAPLTIRVYDDDGPVAGGTILAEQTGVAASGPSEWVEFDFSDASITITEGDFYIACIWEIGANPGPTCYVGLDENGSFEDRTWLIIDSGATWSQDELHTYFPNSEIGIRCTAFGPSRATICDNMGPATEAMETYDLLPWQEGDKPFEVLGSPSMTLGHAMEIGPRGEATEHDYFTLLFDPSEEGPENNVVGYNLYKSESPGVEALPGNLIVTVDNEVFEYIDYDVVIATEYFYAATALYQGLEESSLSNEDSATPQDDYVAPGPPTDAAAENTVGLTVHVTWVDPTVDENGFPLDDLTTLTIYRDDAPVGSVGPGVMAYDDVCPTDGEFFYYVTASDEVPNESVPSNEVLVVVGDPGYVQDFELSDGGFTTSGSLNDWQWGAPTSGPGGAHSGVNLWGINLAGDYSVMSDSRLTSVTFTAYELCEITFWTWWDTEAYYDGWNCKVSTDAGATWEIVTPDGGYPEDSAYSGNAGIPLEPCYSGHIQGYWEQIRVDLSSYGTVGGTPMQFRWHFGSDGSVQYPGPYIDDVVIWDASRSMTDVEDGITFMPKRYALNQNRPNPFNPVTEIQFAIPEAGNVRLEVYNLQGQLVKTLVNEARPVGFYSVTWDGTNNNGAQVASGVYFYRIDCNDFGETKKMIILK
jgi:fibronectin type 3 domain-containing protein